MSTHGQRFRRRALRRGYKVDEVDIFLDRVESTLAGEPTSDPVSAQEVHDIVFRVRFGGYDEWQVDLHLDRVERQLSELEERGTFARPGSSGMGDRLPERIPLPERVPLGERQPMGPPGRMGPPAGQPDRMGPPMGQPDRMGPPMGQPDRMRPPMGQPEWAGQPTGPRRDDRGLQPGMPPLTPAPAGRATAPTGMQPPVPPMPQRDPYGRYDDGFTSSFNGFEAGRRGRADMTSEIRMPDSAPPPSLPPEVQRIDHMRRAFMPRRFGSGYDPVQVDQVFEGIIAALSGRSSVPIREAELDPAQFSLVPGGYFEAEVDAALKEARDLMRRR